ncbi:acylsugar acyltransferase 3-like [Benincasa hispida]|uniref:acylsugar acyltransferase 3-like n=1 Tax=Benincasa hispida TaxID=102211 RepID=UPI00190071A7|nr:acylsugar acyltransferase 3-like [Benincasa hispida]
MEFQIVCEDTIKPLSSTPPELRIVPLCLFDQEALNVYLPIFFFYNIDDDDDDDNLSSDRCRVLKDSLSKALTFYYPFAGRLILSNESKHFSSNEQRGGYVDCNDMGVTFLEAKAGCPMSEIMYDNNLQREERLKLLLLDDMNKKDHGLLHPLMSIQLTQFECGGEVICVSVYHKLVDITSTTNFMRDWASIARSFRDGDPPTASPQFNAATFFRPELDTNDGSSGGQDESGTSDGPSAGQDELGTNEKVCNKRLVFESSKIAALKAMVSEKVENPTRVQLVAALIYKAAISAKFSVTGCLPEISLLLLVINLRNRVEPPLPTLIGNILTSFIASSTTKEHREMELWDLVSKMKRNLVVFCKKFPKDYKSEEWGNLYKSYAKESMEMLINVKEPPNVYVCSSWCKFPVYSVDFGWGKPIWVTIPEFPRKNVIMLLDTNDGEGIEVLLSLEKKEMEVFEQNQELFSFCEIKK